MALTESQSEASKQNCSKPEIVIEHEALLQIKTRLSNPEGSQIDGGPSSTSSILMAMKPIEEGSEQCNVAAADCVMDQVSSLACVLSKKMEAERLQEIFDALEKERLELPKIRTDCRNKIGATTRTNSPRDSGGVKRIAEQLKMGSKQDKSKEENDVVEGGTITKGRPHWNRIQQQKQAVVF